VVDRAVLELVQRHTFTPGDFTLTPKGVCRLNPQLARVVVKVVDLGREVENLVRHFVSRLTQKPAPQCGMR